MGVDDLYTARAANLQQTLECLWLAGLSRKRLPQRVATRHSASAGCWGETGALLAQKSLSTRAAARQPALAGCGRLSEVSCPSSPHPPQGSAPPALLGQLAHTCSFRQDPPPTRLEGGRRLLGVGYSWAPFGGSGELKLLLISNQEMFDEILFPWRSWQMIDDNLSNITEIDVVSLDRGYMNWVNYDPQLERFQEGSLWRLIRFVYPPINK